jgi:hypothetical protein
VIGKDIADPPHRPSLGQVKPQVLSGDPWGHPVFIGTSSETVLSFEVKKTSVSRIAILEIALCALEMSTFSTTLFRFNWVIACTVWTRISAPPLILFPSCPGPQTSLHREKMFRNLGPWRLDPDVRLSFHQGRAFNDLSLISPLAMRSQMALIFAIPSSMPAAISRIWSVDQPEIE